MIGLILVTHGRLAEEFIAATEHVIGPQPSIASICIGSDDDIEGRRDEITATANRLDDGDGVIILTDMFGGTPSNLAISILNHTHTEVIAGVNLPMLIKLASERSNMSLKDAVEAAQEAGKRYIAIASNVLGRTP